MICGNRKKRWQIIFPLSLINLDVYKNIENRKKKAKCRKPHFWVKPENICENHNPKKINIL